MGRLTRGHWGIFPVSETLRQAEGKPEDPLQALTLPARGNPLLPGWKDPEAEGGYQVLRNHLSNLPAAFLLGLACGYRGCLRTSGLPEDIGDSTVVCGFLCSNCILS